MLLEPPAYGDEWWAHPFIAAAVERHHPGLVVKAWREAHWPDRISQAKAARLFGVSQPTLCNWETREHPPYGPDEWDSWFNAIKAPAHLRWWRTEEKNPDESR